MQLKMPMTICRREGGYRVMNETQFPIGLSIIHKGSACLLRHLYACQLYMISAMIITIRKELYKMSLLSL